MCRLSRVYGIIFPLSHSPITYVTEPGIRNTASAHYVAGDRSYQILTCDASMYVATKGHDYNSIDILHKCTKKRMWLGTGIELSLT